MMERLPSRLSAALTLLAVLALGPQSSARAEDSESPEAGTDEAPESPEAPESDPPTEPPDEGGEDEDGDPAQGSDEETPESSEAEDGREDDSSPAGGLSEAPAAEGTVAVVRLVGSGRVGAGLLAGNGSLVVTVLEIANVGHPVVVQLPAGRTTRGRVVAVDRDASLALLALDEAAEPVGDPDLRLAPAVLGEPVSLLGHGGSSKLGPEYWDVRELVSYSLLQAHVASQALVDENAAPGELPRTFLIDREVGVEDRGAPLLDSEGRVLGLVGGPVDGAGGRTVVVSSSAVADLLDEPRLEKPFRRAHHLQSWGGFGLAAHSRPSHLAGLFTLGFRAVFLDAIRLEPWAELDLGTRAPTGAEDSSGARPRDLWWSVETGLSVGYRAPLFVEGGRNYVVPNVGFRIGWNRFQHTVKSLDSVCTEGEAADCSFVLEETVDQERSLRAGIDVGIDVRRGPVRIGYRFFIDPLDVQGHAMHRIFVTLDGFPLPLAIGDSN